MEFIIYNTLFFLAVLVWYQYRKKEITAVTYILSIWLASSVFSIFHVIASDSFERLSLLPSLYFYACFLISLYPVYKFDENCLKNIRVNEVMLNIFIWGISAVAIIPFFENLIHLIDSYLLHPDTYSMYSMYEKRGVANVNKSDLYSWLSPVGRICNSAVLLFRSLTLLLFFYCLTREKIDKLKILGILMVLLNMIFFWLLTSARVSVTFLFLFFLFFLLLFRKVIPKRILKKIAFFSLVIAGMMMVGVGIITIARFENHDLRASISLLDWISLYLGEGLANFNDSMWHILRHTEGDRSFYFLKNLLGYDNIDILAFRERWNEINTNVKPQVFYTYLGDWYSDLGVYFTILLTIVLSLITRLVTLRRNSISFASLYIYLSFCYIFVNGFTIFPHILIGYGLLIELFICFIFSIKK
ncbi:MAG: oligosaccharide repeat unit polymerase [Prevotellaceae bacterium]|jgi:oligosaccharide repeat unit polymerase|nr:oligosaccharide repeat unit polymerase [Prevotellaceae bacterium]